jgi:hypothetical protein
VILLWLWLLAFAATFVCTLRSLIGGDSDALTWAVLTLVVVQLGRD